jgi:beta-phosphoglucomutase
MAYQGAIFDVDGVLVDSPHEQAWREAFRGLMEGEWREVRGQTSYSPERFTTAVYQQIMAGKPRMAGARAAMEYFGVPDIDARVGQYAAAKQEHVVKLIEEGRFMAFADALRFILAVKAMRSWWRRRPRPRMPSCSWSGFGWTASPPSSGWTTTSFALG